MNFKEKFIALKTIVVKEVVRILRIWSQTIIPPIITTSLYFIIFGEILFKDRQIIISEQNILYSNYLVPGLVIMAIINSCYTNTSTSFFMNKFQKNFEEMMVSPMPVWIIILGFTLGGMFRGLLNGLIIFITAFMFRNIDMNLISMTVLVAILTAMFFSLAGIVNAIIAKTWDDVLWFPQFILTPMIYLGGVFFSIDMLPASWKLIAQLNPIYHFVNVFRYNLLGVGSHFTGSLFIMIAIDILIFIFAVWTFKKYMPK